MNWRHFLFPVLLLVAAVAALPEAAAQGGADPDAAGADSAPLTVWNRTIVVFRTDAGELSPSERAIGARERLRTVSDFGVYGDITAKNVTVDGENGVALYVGPTFLFGVFEGDLEPAAGETLDSVATSVVAKLNELKQARIAQRHPSVIARGIAVALGATLALAAVLWLLWKARSAVSRWTLRQATRLAKLKIQGVDLRVVLLRVVRRVFTVAFAVIAAAAAYVWLGFVLGQFPYTAPWADALGRQIAALAGGLFDSVLRAIPGVLVVALIFFITRGFAELVDKVLAAFEASEEEGWLSGDSARATRRIMVVMVWIAGALIAYPFIPGSDSIAFKGVGVFLGLMVSLGSTGFVNQVMSGFVVLYSGAVRTGEYATVGDTEGTVTEIGLLSTKLLTPKNELVTVPNALLVGKNLVNFSRSPNGKPTAIGTAVSIGYDTPWRRVESMLIDAATKTQGVRQKPKPRVVQTSLSDFYVGYSLLVVPDEMRNKTKVLSDLHRNIQDVFNENGVQIMSPHFVDQPPQPVLALPGQDLNSGPDPATGQNPTNA